MIKKLGQGITRVVYTKDKSIKEPSYIIHSKKVYETISLDEAQKEQDEIKFETDKKLFTHISCELQERDVYGYTSHCYASHGEGIKFKVQKTVDGERTFIENATSEKIAVSYYGVLTLEIDKDEAIYGLGQHENGIYNYRNVKEYLYQNNMKIPMPVFLSSKNYAVVFDANCLMTYEEKDNKIRLEFDAIDQLSYYIIVGTCFDELIKGIRELTGPAVMLPRWAYGYIQSKERYKNQQEIIDTIKEFKKRDIPLSCIVLDWLSWEEGKWGNKHVDKKRFPDLASMIKELHDNEVAFMISIWPNVNKGSENNKEMLEAGKLLANLSTYNAFDSEARELYWKQCERELFAAGVDAWWCDSTEPFTPDWNGVHKRTDLARYELAKENLTLFLDARDASSYALMHAKGIYENQLKYCNKKRVVNLTRSGSLSSQKYGVILWSGDIKATWQDYRNQIREGLSMSMSGIPYWTLDIGAFFVGNQQAYRRWSKQDNVDAPWFWRGDFEDGNKDNGYRELYVRWLQFATFLPIMRSHGTDTEREPWNFGEIGDKYYHTILKYIKLRLSILPYTYSLAAMVEREDYTIMRSLMFDYGYDKKVQTISEQFMFGPYFLVCPVTRPVEYGPNNEMITKAEKKMVYLPHGDDWYDFDTGRYFTGGMEYFIDTPIEKIPLYVRAGAIIPMSVNKTHKGRADCIHIYEGKDSEFSYYYDNGDDYSYQNGNYALIRLKYEAMNNQLTFHKVGGNYSYRESFKLLLHRKHGVIIEKNVEYKGKNLVVVLL